MKEFKPKTRLQIYKEANFGSIENIPDKYFIEETETLIDNEELTFVLIPITGNYTAPLCDSSIELHSDDVVKIDNVVVPYYDNSATYQTGDLCWEIALDKEDDYDGAIIISIGARPSGTKHASVYQTTKKCTLHPKTKTELYYSAVSHLFSNREIESFGELIGPIPKTVNEKLTYRECIPSGAVDEITPKTRSQWYRAKALELVEAVPESKLPPKTNIEKCYAYKAGLYEGELPEPKTVDEYYIALECGWMPDKESEAVSDDPSAAVEH